MAAKPAATAQDRLDTGHMKTQSLQEQDEREERSLEPISHPDARRARFFGLGDTERDQTRPDIGVASHLVGVGVMCVVLGDPPADAQPRHPVADDQPDEPVEPRERAISW